MGGNNIVGLGIVHLEIGWDYWMKSISLLSVLILFSISILIPVLSIASEEQSVDVSLALIKNQPRYHNGLPIMVAGLWHMVNISFENIFEDDTFRLRLYFDDDLPIQRNKSNYYEWSYDTVNGFDWDHQYPYISSYIDEDACYTSESAIGFCVGIKDSLPNEVFYRENWTIEIYLDQNQVYSEMFILEKPTKGFAKTHGDRIDFRVDPFKEIEIQASDYIILKNTGNVPLAIDIDYTEMNEYITFESFDEQLLPQEKGTYEIVLTSESWQPQFISQSGLATASVPLSYLIIEEANTSSSIYLQSSLVLDVPTMQVFVGHSMYQLDMFGDTSLSYQYKKSISMQEGEINQLHVYISGNGSASLSISSRNENITILDVRLNDKEMTSPVSIISTETSEQIVSITVKAVSENHHGYIDYILENAEELEMFSTNILVGPPESNPADSDLTRSSNMAVLVVCAFMFAGVYIVYSFIKHKKR
jgi:hypothetical protein